MPLNTTDAYPQIDAAMDAGDYTFVLDIPPGFQADLSEGLRPAIQINIDATAMAQAGAGARYIEQVLVDEARDFLADRRTEPALPVAAVTRLAFNPNGNSTWFMAVMQLVNMSTLLGILLTNSDVEPTSRSPNSGRSITSAAAGASPPLNAAATAPSICLATESLNPTQMSSPKRVVGTPDGCSPRSASSSIMTWPSAR